MKIYIEEKNDHDDALKYSQTLQEYLVCLERLHSIPEFNEIEDAEKIIRRVNEEMLQNPDLLHRFATLTAHLAEYQNAVYEIELNPIYTFETSDQVTDGHLKSEETYYVFDTGETPATLYFSYCEIDKDNPDKTTRSDRKFIKITNETEHFQAIRSILEANLTNGRPITDTQLKAVKNYIETNQLTTRQQGSLRASPVPLEHLPSFSSANQYIDPTQAYMFQTSCPFQWTMRYGLFSQEVNKKLQKIKKEALLGSPMLRLGRLTNSIKKSRELANHWNKKLHVKSFSRFLKKSDPNEKPQKLLEFICSQNLGTPYGKREEGALELGEENICAFLNLVLPEYYPNYFKYDNNQLKLSDTLDEASRGFLTSLFCEPEGLDFSRMDTNALRSFLSASGTKDKALWAVLQAIQKEDNALKKCEQIITAYQYMNPQDQGLLFDMAKSVYSLAVSDEERGPFSRGNLEGKLTAAQINFLRDIEDLTKAEIQEAQDQTEMKKGAVLEKFRGAVRQTMTATKEKELQNVRTELRDVREQLTTLKEQVEDYQHLYEECEALKAENERLKAELMEQKNTATSGAMRGKVATLVEQIEKKGIEKPDRGTKNQNPS